MATSPRKRKPQPRIVPTVIAAKGAAWNASTQKVAIEDAERILEALVAEAGLEGTKAALASQGFDPAAYSYLLVPLYEEAIARRRFAGEVRAPAS